MNKNIDDQNEVNKNILLKSFLVGSIPILLLAWFLSSTFEDSFFKTLLVLGGVYLAWVIYRSIITSITFRLFLRKDMINKFAHDLHANNFPKPEDYEMENVEDYLRMVAMDPDNHPRNIIAATMLSEFSHARIQGSMLVLLRLNKVTKEALKKYNYQLSRE